MINTTVVELINVSKRYDISDRIMLSPGGLFSRKKKRVFWALKNVNLRISKGSHVGIIGSNGSGKTTLLKLISKITVPTEGNVKTRGRVTPLINLESGFHSDLSGEDNIYFNGMLMGMNKKQIDKAYKQIVDFSGLKSFINAPYFTYSNGMKFRLAFSLAVACKFDTLILDEVFMSGDIEFQQKTLTLIKEIQKKPMITTIMCSHMPKIVLTLSDEYYKLTRGVIKKTTKEDIIKLVKKRERVYRNL